MKINLSFFNAILNVNGLFKLCIKLKNKIILNTQYCDIIWGEKS